MGPVMRYELHQATDCHWLRQAALFFAVLLLQFIYFPPSLHLVYLPKFCITIVFDFSWDDCNTPGEIETMGYAKSRGDKQGALWSI